MKYLPAILLAAVLAVASYRVYRDEYASVAIGNPQVIVETLDPSLLRFADPWRVEVGRRFANAVVVLCHGGDIVQHEWVAGATIVPGHVTPIRDIIDRTRKLYPDRTIVLLACNTGHVRLTGYPNTYFFPSSVWSMPDRAITAEMYTNGAANSKLDDEFDFAPPAPSKTRWESDPDTCGNVYEAIEAR